MQVHDFILDIRVLPNPFASGTVLSLHFGYGTQSRSLHANYSNDSSPCRKQWVFVHRSFQKGSKVGNQDLCIPIIAHYLDRKAFPTPPVGWIPLLSVQRLFI
jgi:hypothetical protein|uniref:Uncharacterized protein n=2 Tax=Picea TaxID=3328 RepID=A0A101M1G4_PICGL|nr:hypothetical protein ABT39_MTgene3840 [Picea glauca]QHR90174.1 hypothetical protein Q903MT_gene4197 [Picea sitchensis]